MKTIEKLYCVYCKILNYNLVKVYEDEIFLFLRCIMQFSAAINNNAPKKSYNIFYIWNFYKLPY